MEDRLLFLIGSPRSGTTLLQRMIGSHSRVTAPAEPHLITPLAHLGVYHNVDGAPYDHVNSAASQRGFIDSLPSGMDDYLAACRAYTDTLYGKRLEKDGADFLLEKTPAYALVIDFLADLYPKAKYVVLTRHPMAVWSSFANSFFEGDYEAAHRHNRLLERYVPRIAWLLREKPVGLMHVRYEELVKEPGDHLRRICDFFGLSFEPGMVTYGKQQHDESGRGDPIGVAKHDRPTTASVAKWAEEMAADPKKLAFARSIADTLDGNDLKLWGYDKDTLFEPVSAASGKKAPAPKPMNRFRAERVLLKTLRSRIRKQGALYRLVKKIRFVADVLLRES